MLCVKPVEGNEQNAKPTFLQCTQLASLFWARGSRINWRSDVERAWILSTQDGSANSVADEAVLVVLECVRSAVLNPFVSTEMVSDITKLNQ